MASPIFKNIKETFSLVASALQDGWFGLDESAHRLILDNAIQADDASDVAVLLKQHPYVSRYRNGRFVYQAVDANALKVLQAFVNHDADVFKRPYDPADGTTMLHGLSKKLKTETLSFMVANGADINARTKGGETPLMYRAHYSTAEDVLRYIELGAHVKQSDKQGLSALDHALRRGQKVTGGDEKMPDKYPNFPTAVALLNAGAELNPESELVQHALTRIPPVSDRLIGLHKSYSAFKSLVEERLQQQRVSTIEEDIRTAREGTLQALKVKRLKLVTPNRGAS